LFNAFFKAAAAKLRPFIFVIKVEVITYLAFLADEWGWHHLSILVRTGGGVVTSPRIVAIALAVIVTVIAPACRFGLLLYSVE
jgi:hypothetical protein